MITNERQYKITNAQLAKLREGVGKFDLDEAAKRIGSKVLAKAELDALKSEIHVLEGQLQEYESLRSGTITDFVVNSIAELDLILIRARIAQHLSQRELAELVGLKEQQIQRYESQRYASASLHRILEIARVLNIDSSNVAEASTFSSGALEWAKFPAKEMYKRGWFEYFSGSLEDFKQDANEFVENFVTSIIKKPTVALQRKSMRSGANADEYALLAWECRILDLATKHEYPKKYQVGVLTPNWLDELRKLSRLSDGPSQAQRMLEEAGIALIFEPHLPNTYLDGAALLYDKSFPVIGMTLRYDRLDNFWFVLFHELIHVIKHLEKGKLENIFDFDLEEDDATKIEVEADTLAGDALISPSEWETALPRFIQSKEAVEAFAEEIGIHPAIVAGRIRRETNNYIILTDLVGQGQVRKYFPGISF